MRRKKVLIILMQGWMVTMTLVEGEAEARRKIRKVAPKRAGRLRVRADGGI